MSERQQEELEQERMEKGLAVLQRLACGYTNMDDVWYLAAELGLSSEFQKTQQRKAA